MRQTGFFIACLPWLLLVGAASPAGAKTFDPDYLSEWPSVETVLRDHAGNEPGESLARQMAALQQLSRAIEERAGPRRWHGLTPDEIGLRGQYGTATERLRAEAHSRFPNELGPGFHPPWVEAPLQRWYALEWKYESDPATRTRTLQRYFSPATLAALQVEIQAADERADAARDGLHGPPGAGASDRVLDVVGLTVVAGAGLLLLWALRAIWRRFGRRSVDTSIVDQAAGIVVDSLLPYIRAAEAATGGQIKRTPHSDMFVAGFLLAYSDAACQVVTGGSPSPKEIRSVYAAVLSDPRLRRLVEPREPGTPEAKLTEDVTRLLRITGGRSAKQVLNMFAGDPRHVDLAALQQNPPRLPVPEAAATPLHPEGKHAADARRLLTSVFADGLAGVEAD